LIDSSTDQSIGKPHCNRYRLQTAYGVLKHHHGARHLEKVPNGVLSAIADNPAVITLRVAAGAVSRNPTGSQLEHTATTELPVTLSSRTCTIHCYPRGLVMETAATNQAEWMRMEVSERLWQQDIKRRIARMKARWNRYGL